MDSVEYPAREGFLQTLRNLSENSIDALVMITGAFISIDLTEIKACLDESIRALKVGGILFVQGGPAYLPELGVYLDQRLTFKYWIAIQSIEKKFTAGLPSTHAAVLLFVKGGSRFRLNQVRFHHEICSFCGKSLRDWGGKTHLMNPNGYAASDVWLSLPVADNYTQVSPQVLETILKLVASTKQDQPQETDFIVDDHEMPRRIVVGPMEGVASLRKQIAEPVLQYNLPGFGPEIDYKQTATPIESNLWDVVYHGDALEVLRKYPDNSVDLVFADPPYNLDKNYSVYNDEHSREVYISWCNSWLLEYVRILKPSGSLYLLNLPRWSMYHSVFLNNYLYFQNWIVWDALSEPRGKLMPAHYGLLFYTKSLSGFTFNDEQIKEIDSRQYCLRASCVRRRKSEGIDTKDHLTDIWSDIHRLKHRRDRDYHPCQLPDTLMERIIRLSTKEGDIVLDALAGTGTTAVVTKRLKRHYVAIDIDNAYVQITQEKLAQVEKQGFVQRQSTRRPRPPYSKKALQLELQRIASEIGRLPTLQDVQVLSPFGLEPFLQTFPTWGKALKAAKLEVMKNGSSGA